MSEKERTRIGPVLRLEFTKGLNRAAALNSTAIRVGAEILTYVGPNGEPAFPSHATLACALGFKPRAVLEATKALARDGWFDVRSRRGSRSDKSGNEYHPIWNRAASENTRVEADLNTRRTSHLNTRRDADLNVRFDGTPPAPNVQSDTTKCAISRHRNTHADAPEYVYELDIKNSVESEWWNHNDKITLPHNAELPSFLFDESIENGLDQPGISFARFSDFFTAKSGKSEKRDGQGWLRRWRLWVAEDVKKQSKPDTRPGQHWNRRALTLRVADE